MAGAYGRKVIIGFWITGMLIFGTGTAVVAKTMLQTCGNGLNGHLTKFNRPWMQTMLMFIAMTLALAVYFALKCCKPKPSDQEYSMLDADAINEPKKEEGGWKIWVYIMIPSLFDLFATTISGIGLLWVDASVYQMLRGSLMIFSAILSICCLGRKLKPFHYIGIATTTLAVTLVGYASVKSASADANQNMSLEILGIFLIVGGQFIQASQMVAEEVLLKDFGAPALVIVGMEGFWGVLWMIVLMAIIQFTPGFSDSCLQNFQQQCIDTKLSTPTDCSAAQLYHEDTEESLYMIGTTMTLGILTIIYCIAILGYNVSGMNVTKQLTAIHRTILEAMRTLCIWIVQLFIFYAVKWGDHGEKWNDWSYMQAGGFVLLILGSLIYNKIIRVPCISQEYYISDKDKQEKLTSEPIVSQAKGSSSVGDSDV